MEMDGCSVSNTVQLREFLHYILLKQSTLIDSSGGHLPIRPYDI
jgi:hypothetical protein